MPEPGTLVGGKFRVEQLLGRGGMGTVYAATHIHLGTRVALKFLTADVAENPHTVERFMREARASAQLHSDHVCKVSDVASEDGVPYIVMELLEGEDLAKVRRIALLAPAVAADYVLQACAGIAEAHAAGIVHRDLKPGNLFLCRRPNGAPLVKVLDFGVAKAPPGDGDFNLTQTANIIGSPGYMSPEQLRSSKVVDGRADIWALGVILFELVLGTQPFRAESLTDLALAIAMDPTPPLDQLPPAYAAVVARCLEKDPERRFQDVGALAAALAPLAQRQAGVDAVQMLLQSASTPRMSHAVTAVHTPVHGASQVQSFGAVTTLGAASGVVVPPTAIVAARAEPRRMPWIPVIVAGALIGVGVGLLGFGRSSDHAAEMPVRPAAVMSTQPAPAVEAPVPAAVVEPTTPPTPAPAPTVTATPAVPTPTTPVRQHPVAHPPRPAPAPTGDVGASRI